MISKTPKQGDLLRQLGLPGGICVFIQSVSAEDIDDEIPEDADDWPRVEPDMFEVLHPTLGYIEEPEYYFETLDSTEGKEYTQNNE
tara:strand:- start:354 stop:611 length:258 start_codon:yes stop_codon:yes gene_type:complete